MRKQPCSSISLDTIHKHKQNGQNCLSYPIRIVQTALIVAKDILFADFFFGLYFTD